MYQLLGEIFTVNRHLYAKAICTCGKVAIVPVIRGKPRSKQCKVCAKQSPPDPRPLTKSTVAILQQFNDTAAALILRVSPTTVKQCRLRLKEELSQLK